METSTYDGFRQDFMDYELSTHCMEARQEGLVTEDFEAIDERYHIKYCEDIIHFLQYSGLYDCDKEYRDE